MAEIFDRVGLTKCWDFVTDILSPERKFTNELPQRDADEGREKEFEQALVDLDKVGMVHLIPAWFCQSMQDDIRRRVSKEFWSFYDPSVHPAIENKDSLTKQFACSVDFLHRVTLTYFSSMRTVRKVQHFLSLKAAADDSGAGVSRRRGWNAGDWTADTNGMEGQMVLFLKSFIFPAFPKVFRTAVEVFYLQHFSQFRKEETEESPEDPSVDYILQRFTIINRQLYTMGLLEHVAGTAITSAVTEHIRSYIHTSCRGDFETPYLESLETYLNTKVLEWLRVIYKDSEEKTLNIDSFRGRLMHLICQTYAEVLIDQLFGIIIEFPDSEPAIKDLRRCLEKIDLRSTLVTSLRKSFEVKLLHPGVNTSDILTAYISAIRALRSLDPPGVILELVCEPVRKYLRSREDTVRCIVSGLTDTESNDLMDELLKGAPQPVDDKNESDDEADSWETWQPDPVDANPETASKRRKEQDIISTLVNVYGSQELFVSEYRTLLADRLLSPACGNIASAMAGGDLERELRYLELLKLRFGEAPLHNCQVMLKDIADSRRINTRIAEVKQQNSETNDTELNAIILSAQFWPAFREEKITLPSQLQNHLDGYTQQYEMLKGNRTLVWKPHLGTMNIELELKDQTVSFNVSPVQAALIMQFQDQKQWTVEELGQALEMAPSVVRRKLAFWQGQGLLKEMQTDVFELVEERRVGPQEIISADDIDDEVESAMATAAQQREEEMLTFWTYITGMLQNLDCLPLERIHSMLRMFAVQGPDGGVSQQDLKGFLDQKVREQKLVFASGVYRLPKP